MLIGEGLGRRQDSASQVLGKGKWERCASGIFDLNVGDGAVAQLVNEQAAVAGGHAKVPFRSNCLSRTRQVPKIEDSREERLQCLRSILWLA